MLMPLLLIVLLIPTSGAAICYLFGSRNSHLARWTSLVSCLLSTIVLFLLYRQLYFSATPALSFGKGLFALHFTVSHIALVFAILSAFVALMSSLISPRSVSSYHHVLIQISLASVFAFLFSASLLYFLLFLELSSFLAWRMGDTTPLVKVMLLNDRSLVNRQVGILLLTIGSILAAQTFGYDVAFLGASATGAPRLLMLLGILALCAQVPFQTWIHDASSAMPSAGLLINTVLTTNLGFYSFYTLFGSVPLSGFSAAFTSYLALATAIICAGSAFSENDIGKMLGYSTASIVALALLSALRGGDMGLLLGIFLVMVNTLIKTGFYSFTAISDFLGLRHDFRFMGGFSHRFPAIVLGVIILSLSLTPFSPTIGFFLYNLITADMAVAGSTWMVVLLMGVLMLYCANSLRIVYFATYGARSEKPVTGKVAFSEILAFSIAVVLVLAFSLSAVIYPGIIHTILGM
jgi:formate hydrogenlyase subunit 3/multisubunit Na+/H+ antiporter MnhD subunit